MASLILATLWTFEDRNVIKVNKMFLYINKLMLALPKTPFWNGCQVAEIFYNITDDPITSLVLLD